MVDTDYLSITKAVRAILLQDWDPLGIRDVPEVSGEYDGYIPAIANSVHRARTAHDIENALSRIESELMGVASDRKCLRVAAEKLFGLKGEG